MARRAGRANAPAPDWQRVAAGWERWEAVLQHFLGGVDPALFRHLDAKAGDRVLDLGCGLGDPTLALATLVGPRGRVVGLDPAPMMLAIARRRARIAGLRNVTFRRGDMNRLALAGPRFHAIAGRFSIFLAEDLVGTLERVHALLRPAGRAAFAVWGPLERNALWSLRARALAGIVPPDAADPEREPGPFRLAREGVLARAMRRAGFHAVRAEAVPLVLTLASPRDLVRLSVDTSASMTNATDGLTRRDLARIHARLERGARRYRSGPVVRFPNLAWVVSGAR